MCAGVVACCHVWSPITYIKKYNNNKTYLSPNDVLRRLGPVKFLCAVVSS